jgi:dihydroorotase
MYDLVVKGGRLFDPGQRIDGLLDVGITGGVIQAVGPDLDTSEAARVMQLGGQLVTPGLIDMHVHVVEGAATPGLNDLSGPPDIAGVHSGVTTVMDGGTTGAWNFGVYPRFIVGTAKTRLLCMLNIAKTGILGMVLRKPEVYTTEDVDLDALIKVASDYSGLVQGIKLRLVGPALESMGVQLIKLSREASHETKLPLMIHLGDLITFNERAGEITKELLKLLEPGDIITHLYTGVPGGLLDANKKALPGIKEVESRGVVFDPAHGRSGLSFDVAQRLAQQGVHPHTISTDLTINGRKGPIHSLTESMSKFLALGYTLEDVVQMTTTNAAKAVGMSGALGAIAVGREADLSVLEMVSGKWSFIDSEGKQLIGNQALAPVHTIRAGELISLDWGPHPWGWLPEAA